MSNNSSRFQSHRKLAGSESIEEDPNTIQITTNTNDKSEDNDSSDSSSNSNSDEQPQIPMQGPLIDAEMTPTANMLAAANPYLNPLHPLHPFKHEFNVKHHYMTPHGMVTYSHGGGSSGDHGMGGGVDISSGGGGLEMPHISLGGHCETVRRQAMLIAKKLMRNQNKILFKKLMNYLLKSKFLIGMTELKLNKILRRRIYNVMHSYSVLNTNNVEFVDVAHEPELSDEDDEEISGVQNYDFSEASNEHVPGSSGELEQMMTNEMEEEGNPHISG